MTCRAGAIRWRDGVLSAVGRVRPCCDPPACPCDLGESPSHMGYRSEGYRVRLCSRSKPVHTVPTWLTLTKPSNHNFEALLVLYGTSPLETRFGSIGFGQAADSYNTPDYMGPITATRRQTTPSMEKQRRIEHERPYLSYLLGPY